MRHTHYDQCVTSGTHCISIMCDYADLVNGWLAPYSANRVLTVYVCSLTLNRTLDPLRFLLEVSSNFALSLTAPWLIGDHPFIFATYPRRLICFFLCEAGVFLVLCLLSRAQNHFIFSFFEYFFRFFIFYIIGERVRAGVCEMWGV